MRLPIRTMFFFASLLSLGVSGVHALGMTAKPIAPAAHFPERVIRVQSDAGLFSRAIWREAQEALSHYGFDAGTPDGLPGPRTREAIRNYQAAQGEAQTGSFSRATMGLLLERYRNDLAADTHPQPDAPGLPAPVSAEIAATAELCEVSPERLLAQEHFLRQGDLNGDGEADYILDGAQSGCLFTCGAANCSVTVFASDGRGRLKRNDFLAPGVTLDTFVCDENGTCRFRRTGEATSNSQLTQAARGDALSRGGDIAAQPAPAAAGGSTVLGAESALWAELKNRPSADIGNKFSILIAHFSPSYEENHYIFSAANRLDTELDDVTIFLVELSANDVISPVSVPIGPATFGPDDGISIRLPGATPLPALTVCWEGTDARTGRRVIGVMDFQGQPSTQYERAVNYAAKRPAAPVIADQVDRCAGLTGMGTYDRIAVTPMTPDEANRAAGVPETAAPEITSEGAEPASHVLSSMNAFYDGENTFSYPGVPPFILDIFHTTGVGSAPHYNMTMQSHLGVPVDEVRIALFDVAGDGGLTPVGRPLEPGFFDSWGLKTHTFEAPVAAERLRVCWEGVFSSDGELRVGIADYYRFEREEAVAMSLYAAIPQAVPLRLDPGEGCGGAGSGHKSPTEAEALDLSAGLITIPAGGPEHMMFMAASYAENKREASEPPRFMFQMGNMNAKSPLMNVAYNIYAVEADGGLVELSSSRNTGQFVDVSAIWLPTPAHPVYPPEILLCWEHDDVHGRGRAFEAIPMKGVSMSEPGGPDIGMFMYEKTAATQVLVTSDPMPCSRFMK